MDNLLIECKKDDTYSLRKLLRYYGYLFCTSIIVSAAGFAIYTVLLIQLYTQCKAQTGQQVCIMQLISYVLQGVFSFACLHMVEKSTLCYVNISVVFAIVAKLIALIFAIIVKNRNWGECYISQSQGVMLVCNLCIEIGILLTLYVFTRRLYFRLEEKQLRVPLKMLFQ